LSCYTDKEERKSGLKKIFLAPHVKSDIRLKFVCSKCGKWVVIGPITLLPPGLMGSPAHKYAQRQDICENCTRTFYCDIFAEEFDFIFEIDRLEEYYKVIVDVEEYLENETLREVNAFSNSDPYENFKSQLNNLNVLLEQNLPSEETQQILRKQIFASGITLLESYLSETLISKVMKDENYFRQFVEEFNEFKQEKIAVSEIYNVSHRLKKIVPEKLLGLLYHNIAKIGQIYENVFGVRFGDFSDLSRAVEVRHDIVHRNGSSKDGKRIRIGQSDVETLYMHLSDFVEDLESKFSNLKMDVDIIT
jgi:hypothetical protein